MSIKVTYRNGVFEPVKDVTSVPPGQNYTAFSDEELAEIRSTIGLNAAEKSFEFEHPRRCRVRRPLNAQTPRGLLVECIGKPYSNAMSRARVTAILDGLRQRR